MAFSTSWLLESARRSAVSSDLSAWYFWSLGSASPTALMSMVPGSSGGVVVATAGTGAGGAAGAVAAGGGADAGAATSRDRDGDITK